MIKLIRKPDGSLAKPGIEGLKVPGKKSAPEAELNEAISSRGNLHKLSLLGGTEQKKFNRAIAAFTHDGHPNTIALDWLDSILSKPGADLSTLEALAHLAKGSRVCDKLSAVHSYSGKIDERFEKVIEVANAAGADAVRALNAAKTIAGKTAFTSSELESYAKILSSSYPNTEKTIAVIESAKPNKLRFLKAHLADYAELAAKTHRRMPSALSVSLATVVASQEYTAAELGKIHTNIGKLVDHDAVVLGQIVPEVIDLFDANKQPQKDLSKTGKAALLEVCSALAEKADKFTPQAIRLFRIAKARIVEATDTDNQLYRKVISDFVSNTFPHTAGVTQVFISAINKIDNFNLASFKAIEKSVSKLRAHGDTAEQTYKAIADFIDQRKNISPEDIDAIVNISNNTAREAHHVFRGFYDLQEGLGKDLSLVVVKGFRKLSTTTGPFLPSAIELVKSQINLETPAAEATLVLALDKIDRIAKHSRGDMGEVLDLTKKILDKSQGHFLPRLECLVLIEKASGENVHESLVQLSGFAEANGLVSMKALAKFHTLATEIGNEFPEAVLRLRELLDSRTGRTSFNEFSVLIDTGIADGVYAAEVFTSIAGIEDNLRKRSEVAAGSDRLSPAQLRKIEKILEVTDEAYQSIEYIARYGAKLAQDDLDSLMKLDDVVEFAGLFGKYSAKAVEALFELPGGPEFNKPSQIAALNVELEKVLTAFGLNEKVQYALSKALQSTRNSGGVEGLNDLVQIIPLVAEEADFIRFATGKNEAGEPFPVITIQK